MGLTISSLFQKLFERKPMKILMLGLDGAGKTTILYHLKLGEILTTTPTIGFNVESVAYKNISFTVWDVGGQEKIRQLWRFYFDNTDGIIFVVDCNDTARLKDVAKELMSICQEPMLQNAALLLFANKQDLPQAISRLDLIDKLGLSNLSEGLQKRKWHVQSCVATKSQGVYDGLDWLSNQLDAS